MIAEYICLISDLEIYSHARIAAINTKRLLPLPGNFTWLVNMLSFSYVMNSQSLAFREAAREHWHDSVATDSLAVEPTGVLHLMLIVITFNMFPYCPALAPYPMLILIDPHCYLCANLVRPHCFLSRPKKWQTALTQKGLW